MGTAGLPVTSLRVALYGGSFNPPHVAHQMGCLYALSAAGVDEVWMMPSFQHPFAKRLVPFEERVELCRRAAAPFGGRVLVSRIEEELQEGRTLPVVEALQLRYPQHRFWLVVGTDALADRSKWFRFDELERRIPLIVLGRQGVEDIPGYQSSPALPRISSTDVRARLASGEDVSRLIPQAVLERVQERGLYR